MKDDITDTSLAQCQQLLKAGELEPAQQLLTDLCANEPANWQAWNLLAATAGMLGDYHKAMHCSKQAIQLQPSTIGIHINLANALRFLGRVREAEEIYRKALQLQSDNAQALNNLGTLLLEQERFNEAGHCFTAAIESAPDYAEASNNLAIMLSKSDRFHEAELACRRALKINPAFPDALANLAEALHKQGLTHEAIRVYKQALALGGRLDIYDNYLFCLNYIQDLGADEIAARHFEYGQYCTPNDAIVYPHLNSPDPARRLKIAYVSADLITHPVASFMEALLKSYTRSTTTTICYSDTKAPDQTTAHLSTMVDLWRDTSYLDNVAFADQVRADQVDILVDLAGHTGANRLPAFTMRAAPVQVSYLGYPNTTGLRQMDYRITDAAADPPGTTEPYHSEELVRLQGGFLCYTPDTDMAEISPLPCAQTDTVTFASFNNITKVNKHVLDTWSRLLEETPGSRLIIKYRFLAEERTRTRFRELFTKNGIDTDRIELLSEQLPRKQHLAVYNRVDIALDPFPYNGTTTSCEALWMGVPVVTLAGTMHAGRVGVSLLTRVGLQDLIANDTAEYIRIAAALAADRERLARLRTELRPQMAASPLCDPARFVRDIETAYRRMWTHWCRQHAASKPGKA